MKEFDVANDKYAKEFPVITGSKDNKFGGYERCYHKHPPLKLPGTDLLIYGGSCNSPVIKDASIYIGFQSGMPVQEKHYPWDGKASILHPIRDTHAPDDPEDFKTLVLWTKGMLEKGFKIHCGCIGGHGRTGTFFAALCSEFGEKDAIHYVRENYCPKVVESVEQVKFLGKHYGVKEAKPSKFPASENKGSHNFGGQSSMFSSGHADPTVKTFKGDKTSSPQNWAPMLNGKSLWL